MKRIIFFLAVILLYTAIGNPPSLPLAMAMGKRPNTQKNTGHKEFVSPEIEIISKPEKDIDLLSDKKQRRKPSVGVSPREVLPTIGKDSADIAKKVRTADIQKALSAAGLSPGPIDGRLGDKTKKAIREFQRVNELTIDGVVGPKTWEILKPYLLVSKDTGKNQ
ncbi:MAG: peptidoglycan-binding domain-containing protein [Candidatus Omnitrophota bacterium]